MAADRIPLVCVCGPTASGKTALAVALAERFGGEVVSCDSMQVYRTMDIGTAKPTLEEQHGIPHHLIDCVDPGSPFSVAEYVHLAGQAIKGIRARGHLPVLAGGTGLYADSLLYGIDFTLHTEDASVRNRLEQELAVQGAAALYRRLCERDPQAAQTIHPNNKVRLVRALEMMEVSGKTLSQLKVESRKAPSPYRVLRLGLSFCDRQVLYRRIDLRVDEMMRQGLLDEAFRLYSSGFGKTASGAIGYKELFAYFGGFDTLEHCVGAIKQATRRYAKRQLTWFRRNPDTHWLLMDEYENTAELYEAAFRLTESFLREVQEA